MLASSAPRDEHPREASTPARQASASPAPAPSHSERASIPNALALIEAAREALLAALLVDEGGLPARLAEVADLTGTRRRARRRHRPAHLADVLAEHARERVRQRQDLGRP